MLLIKKIIKRVIFGIYWDNKKKREIILNNYKIIGNASNHPDYETLAKEALVSYSDYIYEVLVLVLNKKSFNINFFNLERLDEALSLKRGVIVNTAHIGNWDAGSLFEHRGIKLKVVANLDFPFAGHLIKLIRSRIGFDVIPAKGGLREIISSLKKNQILCMLSDIASNHPSEYINFLNHKIPFPKAAFQIASSRQCPILPVFIIRKQPFSFDCYIEEYIKPKKDYKATMQEWVNYFEKYVKTYPQQWYIFLPMEIKNG
ncbi:lysophospholipid acyltransferase family protein [Thermodesulfobium acidiphilum]|uniref:lysophospholipid acyltransferase family protein n=1 Tax=Thermodesulfobium acidiphilum TaxID=1794699 RepID=UPI000D39BB71|nr:lysophospholipid acyltransferase family protein [Thermodesulfobium acidiphilum]